MNITLLQENLSSALKTIGKAIPSRPQLPILSSLLLEVKNDTLYLSATDLYIGMRASVSGTNSQEGAITVPAQTFIENINSLSAGEIHLSLQDDQLQVKTSNTTSYLPYQASDDYPVFPDSTGKKCELSQQQMTTIGQYVGFSAAQDQARLVLTTILFHQKKDKKLEVVATDGFRLSVLQLDVQAQFPDKLLIPGKAFLEIVKIVEQRQARDVVFTHSSELKQLFFTIENTEIFIRLVEGDFPPYQKILPSSFEHDIEIEVESLSMALKQAMVFAKEASNIVHFSYQAKQKEIVVTAKSSGRGSFTTRIPVASNSKTNISIAFNVRYVIDFLTQVKPEKVILSCNDPLKPARFQEPKNSSYQYIIMPFKTNE